MGAGESDGRGLGLCPGVGDVGVASPYGAPGMACRVGLGLWGRSLLMGLAYRAELTSTGLRACLEGFRNPQAGVKKGRFCGVGGPWGRSLEGVTSAHRSGATGPNFRSPAGWFPIPGVPRRPSSGCSSRTRDTSGQAGPRLGAGASWLRDACTREARAQHKDALPLDGLAPLVGTPGGAAGAGLSPFGQPPAPRAHLPPGLLRQDLAPSRSASPSTQTPPRTPRLPTKLHSIGAGKYVLTPVLSDLGRGLSVVLGALKSRRGGLLVVKWRLQRGLLTLLGPSFAPAAHPCLAYRRADNCPCRLPFPGCFLPTFHACRPDPNHP